MAVQGTGYRTVNDLLIEVSYHLVEPFVATTATSWQLTGYGDGGYGDGGYGDPPLGSSVWVVGVLSVSSMYVGAQLVVGTGAVREAVTILALDPDGLTFTAFFLHGHAPGEPVYGATFPNQVPTDPLYTQAEMLGYLSRAQNEFLARVPIVYALFQQRAVYGQIFQNTPPTAIEIERIAASSVFLVLTSLVRSAGVVTATTADPHGLQPGATPYAAGMLDASFVGTFEVLSVPSPTTLTWRQDAADAATSGGQLLYWVRLYEYTQEELTQQYRRWRNAYVGVPSAWFEDRSGLYRFGLNGKPASNFPLELLCSIRDDDALGYGDSFLVPDLFLHFVKYKLLEYTFSKDGVASDPLRAGYCAERFQKGVAVAQRWIAGVQPGAQPPAV